MKDLNNETLRKLNMVGIDLAKNIFHLHGIDKKGNCLFSYEMNRTKMITFLSNLPKCIVVMEACGTSHYWGQTISGYGHNVKLINPAFVKPFVKSNKNDRNDAEAICEAASRPSMRFVPIKNQEQQDILAIHSAREMVVENITRMSNQLRSLLAERGIVMPRGIKNVMSVAKELILSGDKRLSSMFRDLVEGLIQQLANTIKQRDIYDKQLIEMARINDVCFRLMTIPGIGPICATALYAMCGYGYDFKNGRQMAAWIGLIPRQNSSGGKHKLLSISKRGNCYLRKQIIHGARAVFVSHKRYRQEKHSWLTNLESRKHPNVIAVAIANKNIRIAYAIMRNGGVYQSSKAQLSA